MKKPLALDLSAFYEMLQRDGARAEFSPNGRYAFTQLPGMENALWALEGGYALLVAEGRKAKRIAKDLLARAPKTMKPPA